MTMDSGTKVKVIGGKHKGQWGFIKRAMPEFSFVVLKIYRKSISLGDDEDVCVDTEVRAKNIYLEVIPETVFEMPEASDLVELGPCDDHDAYQFPQHPPVFQVVDSVVDELLAHKQMPAPLNDEDLLSEHSDDEPVNITGILPTVDEALSLAHKQLKHSETISELETQNHSLLSSLQLFIQLADVLRDKVERTTPSSVVF